MPNHTGSDSGARDATVDAADSENSGNRSDDVTSAGEKQLRLVFTFPILLGLFIVGVNLLVMIRLWRTVYFSSFGLLFRANLPNTACITAITISLVTGLALIGYAIALRQLEGYERESEATAERTTNHEPHRASYAKWMVVPVLVAIPALGLAVWASVIVQPITAKPCIEIYQEALKIKKDNPDFQMIWNDRDQLRCSINQVLEQQTDVNRPQ